MLFIFDENYPPEFVRGFSIIETANHHNPIKAQIIFAIDFMGKSGASDEELIAKASKQKAIIITQDSDFRRIKHYKTLLIEHEVGYIYFKVPKGSHRYWDIVKAFVNKWDEIKQNIKKDTIPFAYEINKTGQLSKVEFG
jgi:PIN domain-containing protein